MWDARATLGAVNEASPTTAATTTAATSSVGADRRNGDAGSATDIALFGDPRSPLVQRGPDRRRSHPVEPSTQLEIEALRLEVERLTATHHSTGPGRALRLGRGDGFATALNVLGLLVFVGTLIVSSLIFYNAQNVGAFSDPWDSSRVAIGCAVLSLGLVHAAVLIGVARAITYQLATLRLKIREAESVQARSVHRG